MMYVLDLWHLQTKLYFANIISLKVLLANIVSSNKVAGQTITKLA